MEAHTARDRGPSGDERQALGTFTSQLIDYARTASELHEHQLIDLGHPNEFVRNPRQHKKDWDALQTLHPKAAIASLPVADCISLADTETFGALMLDIYCMGPLDDPPYLKIQKFQAAKLGAHLAAGGTKADFKRRIRKSLLNHLVMQLNSLLYLIDPNGTKKVMEVARRLEPVSTGLHNVLWTTSG